MDPNAAAAPGVLSHLRVVDLSWYAAGPLTGTMLAYHGATVVKVESTVKLDVRRSPPYPREKPGVNSSSYYGGLNLGKYAVAVDLNKPAGLEATKRLIDWADVFIEAFTPGTLVRWGLDYPTLQQEKPGLIMLSMSLHGQNGPYARLAGFGLQVQGMSGLSTQTGWSDGPPTGVTLAYPDYIAPLFGLFAVTAALDYRDRTGVGQHIDLAQMDMSLNLTGAAIPDYVANGRRELRDGNRLLGGDAPETSPHGVYPTRGDDRWIAIAVFGDEQWRGLCRVIQREEWLADERFATQAERCRNDAVLDGLVGEATRTRDAAELMAALQQAGVAAGVVHDQQGLFSDPQLLARGHYVPMEHPIWGEYPFELPGVRLPETPVRVQRRAPFLAEHNEFVFRDLLGYSEEEYYRLVADGGIEYSALD